MPDPIPKTSGISISEISGTKNVPLNILITYQVVRNLRIGFKERSFQFGTNLCFYLKQNTGRGAVIPAEHPWKAV
jgi:hypothetical protein